ncbi:MAG TPA: response regulator [Nannocystaceae bacterium]|nr:response regulator [Nannocystaceae bacterium]
MKTRVLIVDDNHDLADNLAELLEDEGYATLTAYSGERAVELAAAQPFDIVLTDIRMPGMNGVELVKKLSSINEKAIFLLMTAYTSDAMLGEALRAGVRAILNKPVELPDLLARLPHGAVRVLLIEDDAQLADLLADALSRHGFEVDIALTCEQAREPIARSRPDVAVADVFLPDGNGAQLAREICLKNGIPVVLMTGYDSEGATQIVQSLPARSSRFVAKPFRTEALLDALHSLVEGAGS